MVRQARIGILPLSLLLKLYFLQLYFPPITCNHSKDTFNHVCQFPNVTLPASPFSQHVVSVLEFGKLAIRGPLLSVATVKMYTIPNYKYNEHRYKIC